MMKRISVKNVSGESVRSYLFSLEMDELTKEIHIEQSWYI